MNKHSLNREIKGDKVRLLSEDGKSPRVVAFETALNIAKTQNLDLVQVGNGEVPVCKIIDYNKMLYQQKKAERQNRQGAHEVKEIRVGPNIDKHDMEIKANNARKFLKSGHKVRLFLKLKGRERQRPEIALAKAFEIAKMVEDVCKIQEKGNEYILVPS